MDPARLTPAHESLLRAALLDGADARAAYDRWRALVRFENLDPEEYRILPQLARNLQALGVDDELGARLRGIARRTWYANQIVLRIVADAVSALDAVGIETRVRGGSLATLHHHGAPGACPIDGVDLLVRPQRMHDALAVLRERQWSVVERVQGVDVLRHGEAGFLALHPPPVRGPGAVIASDDHGHVWQKPVVMTVGRVNIALVNPEDQLLFIAERVRDENPSQLLRHLSEAAALLRGTARVDWDDLLAEARLCRVEAALGALLRSAGAFVPGAVPPAFLDTLATPPIACGERGSPSATPRFAWQRVGQACGSLWRSYRRHAAESSAPRTLRGFARYLTAHWEVGSRWRLPCAVGWRAWRLMWGPAPDHGRARSRRRDGGRPGNTHAGNDI